MSQMKALARRLRRQLTKDVWQICMPQVQLSVATFVVPKRCFGISFSVLQCCNISTLDKTKGYCIFAVLPPLVDYLRKSTTSNVARAGLNLAKAILGMLKSRKLRDRIHCEANHDNVPFLYIPGIGIVLVLISRGAPAWLLPDL